MNRPNIILLMCDDLGYGDVGFKCLTDLSSDGSEDLCFDMINDREETTNIVRKERKRMESTRNTLREWLESCKHSHYGGDYSESYEPVAPFEAVK